MKQKQQSVMDKKRINEEGKLILTTPNPFWFEFSIRKNFRRLNVNPEHTAWYDESVLSTLAKRHHFEVVEVKYIIAAYNPVQLKVSYTTKLFFHYL